MVNILLRQSLNFSFVDMQIKKLYGWKEDDNGYISKEAVAQPFSILQEK